MTVVLFISARDGPADATYGAPRAGPTAAEGALDAALFAALTAGLPLVPLPFLGGSAPPRDGGPLPAAAAIAAAVEAEGGIPRKVGCCATNGFGAGPPGPEKSTANPVFGCLDCAAAAFLESFFEVAIVIIREVAFFFGATFLGSEFFLGAVFVVAGPFIAALVPTTGMDASGGLKTVVDVFLKVASAGLKVDGRGRLTPIAPTPAAVAVAGFFVISTFLRAAEAAAAAATIELAFCAIAVVAAGILARGAMLGAVFGAALIAAMLARAGTLGATLDLFAAIAAVATAAALDMPPIIVGGLSSNVDDMGLGVG